MKNNIKTFIILFTLLGFFSCSDLLDETTYTIVSGEDLVEKGSYDQLVTGAFSSLNYNFEWGGYHNAVNFDNDHQSGPAWAYGTMGAGNFYEDGTVNNFYNYYYISIHRANYYKHLISMMKVDEGEKNNAMGELAFLKAWSYFNLVQFYGDLSLFKTSVSEGADFEKPRSPIKDVYAYIIEELLFAEEAMYSVKDPKFKLGHVSSGAAKALLAKVYATIGSASMKSGKIYVMGGPGHRMNDKGQKVYIPRPAKLSLDTKVVSGYEDFDSKVYYTLAMEKAKEVIDSKDFFLYPSQQELWSNSSRNKGEFIFTLQTVPGSSDYSNFVATDYIGYYLPDGTISSGYYVQRDHWYQLFNEEDGRVKWGVVHRVPFTHDSNNNLIYAYYPHGDSIKVRLGLDGYDPSDVLRTDSQLFGSKLMKFTQITVPRDGARSDFNFPFMRYAETVLLYAEAANEVHGGPTDAALNEVEKLNIRNNSPTVKQIAINRPWNQELFRSYILEERGKEFAAEGIRKFDLLRWGIYLDVMNAIDVDEKDVIKRRQQRHLLMPLPANEVNTNPYIEVNNPGW